MKILITPDISPKRNCFTFANILIDLLEKRNHTCIVSATDKSLFNCKTYLAVSPRKKLFCDTPKSHEEWLYNTGRLDKKYLEKDIISLENCIQEEKPDLILDLGRISSTIVSRKYAIPCFSIVNSTYYREKSFPKEILSSLNKVLTQNHLEQVLYVKDLYQNIEKRIGFSQNSVQAFPNEANIERYTVPLLEKNVNSSYAISIFFLHSTYSFRKLHKIVEDTFLGAPYSVKAFINGDAQKEVQNMSFSSKPDFYNLIHSNIILHDGDLYLYHACIRLGIPQILVNTGDPLQVYESAVIKRCGIGAILNENELSVASIYEAYKRITSNRIYEERVEQVRNETSLLNPLESLFDENLFK